MPIAKALAALEAAIKAENANVHRCNSAYLVLLDRIVSYQNGEGSAPSIEEFLAWQDAAMTRAQLHQATRTQSARTR